MFYIRLTVARSTEPRDFINKLEVPSIVFGSNFNSSLNKGNDLFRIWRFLGFRTKEIGEPSVFPEEMES